LRPRTRRAGEAGTERAGGRAREQPREIGKLIDAGRVKPNVSGRNPLAEAAKGPEILAHQRAFGKLVLQLGA
jgi:NADPH:quinone reductase-like Zn-dependent oxidoreductase